MKKNYGVIFFVFCVIIITVFLIGNAGNGKVEKVGEVWGPLKIYEYNAYGGGPYIEEYRETQEGDLHIYYYSSYEVYAKANPETKVSKKEYDKEFKEKKSIEKKLLQNTIYGFSLINNVDTLSITIPYEKKVYSVELSREEFKEFTGQDVDVRTIKENYNEIRNTLVNDPKKLDAFFERFGKIKNL